MAVAAQQTLKDVKHEQWLKDVLASDKKLKANVETYKVEPATVLTTDQHKALSFLTYTTAISKGAADLKRAVAEREKKTKGVEITGVLAGIRDVYGSKFPTRFTILRQNGKHVDVSQFGVSLKRDGKKVDVGVPAQVTLSALYEDEYDSYTIIALDSYTPLDRDVFVDAIAAVAKGAGEISQADHKKVVVVRGRIEFVNPVPKWDDGKQTGEETVWQKNNRKTPVDHPILRLRLQGEDIDIGGVKIPVYVSVTLQRMKNALPFVSVPDLEGACQYALTVDEDPMEQAKQVGDILRGREIIAVGRVSNFDPKHDKIYVNIDAATIIQVADATGYVPTARSKRSGGEEPDEPDPEQSSLDIGADAEEAVAGGEEVVSADEGDDTPAVTAQDVTRYLGAVCLVTQVKPENLNAQEIWEEKYKDAMSYEIFEVILKEYIKARKKDST